MNRGEEHTTPGTVPTPGYGKLPVEDASRVEVENLQVSLGSFDVAEVINIGHGGVAVETHKHLRVGKTCSLRFKRREGILRLQGTAVWSRLVRTRIVELGDVQPVYVAGLEFATLTRAQELALDALIQDSVPSDNLSARATSQATA